MEGRRTAAVFAFRRGGTCVGGASDGTPKGLRNHATLLLLTRTGLRVAEVSKLSLGDIDRVAATICIPLTSPIVSDGYH
jgi:site-specific recombinase XerD